jgi:hypothetical protein
MAEAGMFALEDEDRTKCFFCDIALVKWDRHDDPWLEHARFSPCCGYLLYTRGYYFTKSALELNELFNPDFDLKFKSRVNKYKMPVRVTLENISVSIRKDVTLGKSLSATNRGRTAVTGRPFRNVEPREIRSRLDLNESELLMSYGFPRELVGQVISERLGTAHDDFDSFNNFTAAVFEAGETLGIIIEHEQGIRKIRNTRGTREGTEAMETLTISGTILSHQKRSEAPQTMFQGTCAQTTPNTYKPYSGRYWEEQPKLQRCGCDKD